MKCIISKFLLIVAVSSLLIKSVYAQTEACPIRVSVALSYTNSVVFNAQKETKPLNTYTLDVPTISPGNSGTINVPCNDTYNIVASPNSVPAKYIAHLPGTYSYIGNPVTLGIGGGVSVTFPNDFIKIQTTSNG